MVARKTILLVAMLGLLGVRAEQTSVSEPSSAPVVTLLPRRVDYDVLISSVRSRVAELSNHKYWQTAYALSGASVLFGAWYFLIRDAGTPSGTPGGTAATSSTPKKDLTWFQSTVRYSMKNAVNIFVSGFAFAVLASGKKAFSRLFYYWSAPNKVALYSVLYHAAKNSFDSYMFRKKEGFTRADRDVIAAYNRVSRALQQYVAELSAQILFFAHKGGVCIDADIELLLEQFSRDIDAVNKKITEATNPFIGEQARSEVLLSLALETVDRLAEMYDGFADEEAEKTSSKRRRGDDGD